IWRPFWMHASPTAPAKQLPIFIGPDMLFYPIVRPYQRYARVFLPPGKWRSWITHQVYEGEKAIKLPVPLGKPCLFVREEAELARVLFEEKF
ncbi:MAG: hypothetical protein NZ989_09070, partial [Bacteroidia bacterium]|nr:hypothetical protein [Bacteroidia bacterium]